MTYNGAKNKRGEVSPLPTARLWRSSGTPLSGAKRRSLFAVVRADQREEKAAWMPPAADEGGTEARSRRRRAVVHPRNAPGIWRQGVNNSP
jgi:hypothetical protein